MNASEALFFVTRLVAFSIVFFSILKALLTSSFSSREMIFLISFVLFYFTSLLYQKKRKIFTVGYLFYFLVCFLSIACSSYKYAFKDLDMIYLAISNGVLWPKDYFKLYALVFVSISLVLLFYLSLIKQANISKIKFDTYEPSSRVLNIIVGVFFVFPLYLSGATESAILFVTFFIVNFFFKQGKLHFLYWIGFLISLFFLYGILTYRFRLVQFILPVLLFSIFHYTVRKPMKITKIKSLVYVGGGVAVISIYGIISELIKLNLYYSKNFSMQDFLDIISNYELVLKWADRQFYRVVDVWYHLGGNMIDIVNENNDFYYGLTYIKPLSGFLGVERVSLPEIVAETIRASYAQPGLLAEGYANFGVVGAIVNILLVFFLMEFLYTLFLRKQTVFTLLLSICVFPKIILDGGTINSVIFLIIASVITYSFNFITKPKSKIGTKLYE